jgi:hypothetical protein
MLRKRQQGIVDQSELVRSLYRSLLARPPRNSEEQSKIDFLNHGGNVEDLIREFLASPECRMWFYRNRSFDELTAPEPLPPEVPRLYLWHVPKTGGSSLRDMLRPHFNEIEFCDGLSLAELGRLSLYRLRSFRAIAGHFGPTIPALLPDVDLVTTTLVREPVALVVSHYAHYRDHGLPFDPLSALTRQMTFEQWCRSPATRVLWSNPQARRLCELRILPNRLQAEGEPDGRAIGLPEDQLAEHAIKTLDGIDVVGTTNDILPVYLQTIARIGLTPIFTEPLKSNVGSGLAEPISDETRDWILENNDADLAIFKKAEERALSLYD